MGIKQTTRLVVPSRLGCMCFCVDDDTKYIRVLGQQSMSQTFISETGTDVVLQLCLGNTRTLLSPLRIRQPLSSAPLNIIPYYAAAGE